MALSRTRTLRAALAAPAGRLAVCDQRTFTADARFGGTGGVSNRPPTQVGAGLDYRLVDWLPLRIGGAFVQVDEDNSGVQAAAGLGLRLGPYNISASAAHRNTGLGSDTFGMISLVSFGI